MPTSMTVVETSAWASPSRKTPHHGVFLLRAHLAVEEFDPVRGKHFLPVFETHRRRLRGQLLAVFNERVDEVGLPSGGELGEDELARLVHLAVRTDLGDDPAPVGGQFVEDRNVEVAVDRNRQRAWDRGRGHHQHVRRDRPPGGERGALEHAELVLFVDDHQAEARRRMFFVQERVRADEDVRLTVSVALTITADDHSKVYGAELPTLTASYSGLVNGDTAASFTAQPTLSTTATSASHVSGNPYTIIASGGVDGDYGFAYVAGTLAVTPATLTITADDQSKPYGAELPTLTASYSGLVNGDTSASLATGPTLSTTATDASHVGGGPYAITALGASDGDYTIGYTNGSLSVTPVALTITPDDQVKAYGSGLPSLTVSYSGFVNADTAASLTTRPTLTTTATAASHVSGNPYAITASEVPMPTT